MDQFANSTAPAGLVHVSDAEPGISRRRAGRGFCYYLPDGALLRDALEKARIGSLAIPPAYRDVWICIDPKGHLQATGYDDRARKQYRYHPEWSVHRSQLKFGYLSEFGEALPRIRRRLRQDLQKEAGDLEFTLAAMLTLIDRSAIRAGSPEAERENKTFGVTTLLKRHVRLRDADIRLDYTAKGSKRVRMSLHHRSLHRILEQIADLPGRRLFQWRDASGAIRPVDSGQLNAYLGEISGGGFSVKTFRTWHGTLAGFNTALEALEAGTRPTVKAICHAASEALHNTPAVCRNSYVHPDVIALSEIPAGDLDKMAVALTAAGRRSELRIGESRLLDYLANSAS